MKLAASGALSVTLGQLVVDRLSTTVLGAEELAALLDVAALLEAAALAALLDATLTAEEAAAAAVLLAAVEELLAAVVLDAAAPAEDALLEAAALVLLLALEAVLPPEGAALAAELLPDSTPPPPPHAPRTPATVMMAARLRTCDAAAIARLLPACSRCLSFACSGVFPDLKEECRYFSDVRWFIGS